MTKKKSNKKKPFFGEVGNAPKFLIIQQKMIGDVLTSSILFEALRKKYPEAELHYMVFPNTLPVLENNPFIDKIILPFPPEGKKIHYPKLILDIRNKKFDVVIDVYSKIGSALVTYFSGVSYKIGFSKWYTGFCYSHTVERNFNPETGAGLAVEKRMHLLSPISSDFPSEIKPKIYLTAAEVKNAQQILEISGVSPQDQITMISVLGSGASKTYPKEHLSKILDKIISKTNTTVLFNYIPSQEHEAREIYNLVTEENKENIKFEVFGKSLREFLALTSCCTALIGNEGGAINMAKALNIPTFAIFSPNQYKENWNMYENGKTDVSVHLRDYKPQLFPDSKKKIREKNEELYQSFSPDLFSEKLTDFLKHNYDL